MAGPDKKTKKRLLALLFVYTAFVFALVIRFFWLQIWNGHEYQQASSRQQYQSQIINSNRGEILDRNGSKLAVNLPVVTIVADPSQMENSPVEAGKVAEALSNILSLNKDEVLKKLQQPDSLYQIIKRKVDKEVGDKVKQWATENKVPGIYLEQDIKRYYPGKTLASHVIGFTGIDNQGLSGLESTMEQYLKGLPGFSFEEVDALGRTIPIKNWQNSIEVQDGFNIVSTIDENIQGFAEKALDKAIKDYNVLGGGTAIVMDPRNGDILAMVSKPDYDLNNPYAIPPGIGEAEWNNMSSDDKTKKLQETVWRDKAINITYEPGSTFKAISAAAYLEEGIVGAETEVIDEPIKVAGWTINCSYAPGHGRETFREAMYNSCNPVFVKMAQALGIEKFYKYMTAFGFNEKTSIELPGEAGSIIHKKPTEIDMATASFGQSFQVTPIQMAASLSAIANGGKLLKPRLVKELTDSHGNVVKKFEPEVVRTVISKQTSETLLSLLEGVVAKGTGTHAYVKGYRVAGKTGTSQTVENGIRSEERYIASFAAVAPADDPVLCVLVVLDHPSENSHSGGIVAGPATASIIKESLEYLGIERRYTQSEVLTQETIVPDVKYKTLAEAEALLSERGFEYKILGNGNKNEAVIDRQLPKGGDVLSKVTTVMLYTSKDDKDVLVKMPDIRGKTISQATQEILDAGLNIKAWGSGLAYIQEVNPGVEIPMGTAVGVEFR